MNHQNLRKSGNEEGKKYGGEKSVLSRAAGDIRHVTVQSVCVFVTWGLIAPPFYALIDDDEAKVARREKIGVLPA